MKQTIRYDPSAIGSDLPRSRQQYLARRLASYIVATLRLNRPGFLTTEIVQQINPVYTIPTAFGGMHCKCGHGRLRWRAVTFYSEEPETIKWLESMSGDDVFWDVGANVGLYSIYAAKSAHCKVLAIEPEAQNYALLIENIVLNQAQDAVEAMNLAITSHFGIGKLHVHAVTKGGAYNHFALRSTGDFPNRTSGSATVTQVQMGVTLDDLVRMYQFQPPTHLKIDVDGNEPAIIAGASELLQDARCKSVLIELQKDDPQHLEIIDRLNGFGYRCVSERSNWESRTHREREHEHPATNMIFVKDVTDHGLRFARQPL